MAQYLLANYVALAKAQFKKNDQNKLIWQELFIVLVATARTPS